MRGGINLAHLRRFGREVNRDLGVRKRWKFWSVVQGSKGYQPGVEKGESFPLPPTSPFPPLAFQIERGVQDRLQEV